MRAILIVNPKATTTTAATRDILIGTLESTFDLRIEVTARKGDAMALAEQAALSGYEYVLSYGGDGTVNEIVNGLMASNLGPSQLPMVGPLPGGSANVFARALGFSNSPVQAVAELIASVANNQQKLINLGRATSVSDEKRAQADLPTDTQGTTLPQAQNGRSRYFTFALGVGIDAEVIEAMEGLRARGKRATPTRYLGITLSRFARTNRHEPKITITTQDGMNIYGVFALIVQNTSPWTYFGPLALSTSTDASFETGLDFLAIKQLGLISTAALARRISRQGRAPIQADSTGDFVHAHDQSRLELHASQPMPLQMDGEFHSRVHQVVIESVPAALPVIHNPSGPLGVSG
jgi:diacylglycerol kinase family enzyme